MDASYKIQRGIHVHLIQFFMCPEFWVHIRISGCMLRFLLLRLAFIKISKKFCQFLRAKKACEHYRKFQRRREQER